MRVILNVHTLTFRTQQPVNGGTARVVDPAGDSPAPDGAPALNLLTSAGRDTLTVAPYESLHP
jgi:hypothetical protein